MQIEQGSAGSYRLAQLDDYSGLARRIFPQRPPLTVRLRARASLPRLPGTWGFGLWNDPFGFSLGFGGTAGRLPALPNAAWFFFASPENHLSLHAGQPGNGGLAGSYASTPIPTLLLAPAAIAAPLLWLRPFSRLARRLAGHLIRHELHQLGLDPTAWHDYAIHWQAETIELRVDEALVCAAPAPRPPLGLVLWLDNQFAAWRPDGRLATGTLPTPPDCWVEITDLHLSTK